MESPVDMILLHGIGQTFGVKNELIQLEAIGVDIVRFRRVAVRGGAEVQRGVEPSVELGAALRSIDRSHQRIAVGIGFSDNRRATVGPVGVGEWRRIERRRKSATRWRWLGSSRR